MKILFSHGGATKLFPLEEGSANNYQSMRKFIQDNLPKVPPFFIVKYKDQDSDLVVIESNRDFDVLFDNKSRDYIRASIEDESQQQKQSENSDDESSDEEKEEECDIRLQSDDEAEEKSVEKNCGDKFLEQRKTIGNPILPNKQILNSQITHVEAQPKIAENKNPVKLTDSFTKKTQEMVYTQPETMKNHEPKQKHQPFQEQKQTQESKSLNNEQNKKSETIEQPTPQQKIQKSQPISQSITRSRLSQPSNDKSVARLVRTLFNTEFEQRLQALIPKLMQNLKKQIRVEFPTLLQEQSVQQKQQQEEQISQPLNKQELIHDVPCAGCMKQVIEGIRFKCLQCEDNFCEDCEKIVEHPHNLMKMRFLEVKEEKDEKIIDPKLEFVNKCFYLASYFGGDAKDFRKFVEKHTEKTQLQLFEEYFKKNGRKLKKRMGQRLSEMTKKLGLYFERDDLDFVGLVIRHPTQSFESLIGYVNECGVQSEDSQQQESYSQMSGSLRLNSKQTIEPKDNQKREPTKLINKPNPSNEQKQQFLYFVFTRYQISPHKQQIKARFVEDYFDNCQHLMSLEGMKAGFCEEVELGNKEQWAPVQYSSMKSR